MKTPIKNVCPNCGKNGFKAIKNNALKQGRINISFVACASCSTKFFTTIRSPKTKR